MHAAHARVLILFEWSRVAHRWNVRDELRAVHGLPPLPSVTGGKRAADGELKSPPAPAPSTSLLPPPPVAVPTPVMHVPADVGTPAPVAETAATTSATSPTSSDLVSPAPSSKLRQQTLDMALRPVRVINVNIDDDGDAIDGARHRKARVHNTPVVSGTRDSDEVIAVASTTTSAATTTTTTTATTTASGAAPPPPHTTPITQFLTGASS
jgi:hypothetical protein